MNEPILTIDNVSKSFGGLVAVNEVSFSLAAGQILGLMGPNGAGKTTLVNLICGFYKPDSGTIRFNGRDITTLPAHKVSHSGLARTYQIPQPFGELTVMQNILVAAMYGKGMNQAAAEHMAPEILERTDLVDKRDIIAKEMPTIALKRLEVARALAVDPKVLLVDEAAAGLNEAELPRMLEILENIRQSGVSLILIEHVMKVMREAVDTILVIDEGSAIAEGTPEEVMKNQKVIECYLGCAE